MGNYAYFYIWTHKTSGYQYVGVTTQEIDKRIRQHCGKSSNCVKLRNAIQKYGVDAFDIEYFEWCDEYDLAYIEMILIDELETLSPNGFNLKKGGGSYGSMSEETKKKMSDTRIGENNPMFGKTRSVETKKKHSESITGEKNPMFGKTGEKSHMFGKMGEKHPMFGKTRSVETKKKHSESITGEKHHASKKVYQYDSDGNYIRSFGSYSEAGRSINKHHSYIARCARGDREPDCTFLWSTEFIPDLARWTHTITR
ncbi:GIY-YIG catalytic domain-containing endonuclease [Paramecium bursaria Chlorella virus NYs1]|uniref:GIY-YIG catalytic domain-containing endonuclease n=1 Tax=Paramecium bursaria Chlorella virus NYs1 TaxID=83442 RepID=M1I8W4_9PHYC|nr:GIY-YIG catalytic domain-containing endonuclease [Paramecium bursaria Chlorella virus NYs1]AGE54860.1 GIY-YIG catalytic domain-containing endonuclease [Paramecium bursaria Chlorella virus MA1D]AGE58716.1 GIY-YIG catalytic domain-containing endonuclease [Paramecium bursaria Chlorella virus NYs1]